MGSPEKNSHKADHVATKQERTGDEVLLSYLIKIYYKMC